MSLVVDDRMTGPVPLVELFTQALKNYQLANASFHVLCTLPSATSLSASTSSSVSDPFLTPQPPRRPPRRILVLDSSFNPPTLAHRSMALSALQDARYSAGLSTRVLLLLAINNADKAPKPAAFPQRLAMMHRFAQDLLSASRNDGADPRHVSGRDEETCVDIAVTTEPYFHAKSSAVAQADFYAGVPHRGQAESDVPTDKPEQVYLAGFDTLIRIFDAKYYPANGMAAALDPLFAHARLRVTMRPDAEWGDAAAQRAYLASLRDGELEAMGGRKEWVERVEMVDGAGEGVVSSTKVREAVRGEDWEALGGLVSTGVAACVQEHGLYKEA
ncbi:Nucleotidylyl transferase [Xylariaceae sp. FL0016]|nr:Nucleotidylyl transferase [Xylariaceae sp. FL0016]